MMTFNMTIRLSALLLGLIIVGVVACLPLYHWRLQSLLKSSLFVKIIWWVPIFAVMLIVLYGTVAGAIAVSVAVYILALREFIRNKGYRKNTARWYFALFTLALAHLALWFPLLPSAQSVDILVVVFVVSVLSDVCAFFMGNYLGRHHLPEWLNDHKSWEGVAGQLVGAGIGALLSLCVLQLGPSWLLVAAIGVLSAVGDLINSAAKRSLTIKDWGATIPGHGGVLDRLSSLAFAIAGAFWIVWLMAS